MDAYYSEETPWPCLVCPACGAPWPDNTVPPVCPQCAVPFGQEDGFPVLMPEAPASTEATDFPPDFYAEIFEKEERRYFLYWGRRQALAMLVGAAGIPLADARVLDVGCGTGYALAYFKKRGARTAGVEASALPLRFARKRDIDRLYAARAERLPFAKNQFDWVLSMDVYEHLDDDTAAMAEACRVLAPGGRLVVFVPALRCLWSRCDTMQGHRRRYGRGELEGKLEQAGLAIERSTFLLPTLVLPAWVVRKGNQFLFGEDQGREAAKKEYTMPPPGINAILRAVVWTEARFLRWGRFPFGITAAAIAQKPDV